MARCAHDGLPVFFLGATETECEAAIRKLQASHPTIRLAGYDSSVFDLDADPGHALAALRGARDRGARLIVVCLPPAKQVMLRRFEPEYRPAVGLGAGASLSFYVGEMKRAPAWMSRSGLEWLHRLAHEPRRLWRRYLIETSWAVPSLVRVAVRRLRGKPTYRTCTLES
jgi:N-acetylglucosaminyldiphosphoundecaprenol N-acetyl-beta-D-mannosaminyltransferase